MLGLDRNVVFDEWLGDCRGLYKEILKSISHGEKVDRTKLLQFKGQIVDLIALQELNEHESDQRDIFVDKFISLLDVLKGLSDVKREEKQ